MPAASVAALWTTPVKGLGLWPCEAVALGPLGATKNRAFFLIDGNDRMANGKRVETLSAVRADWDTAAEAMSLTLPDGRVLSEPVTPGPAFTARFFSAEVQVEAVCPALSAELSRFAGTPLRIVRADPSLTANDRGPDGTVSLMSTGSLERLGELAGEAVDPRRFRMLLQVDGLEPHAEDGWVERTVRIGGARVRFSGHVGRCRVTTLDPDTGKSDLAVLDLLGHYRSGLETTEPLALGIYGRVVTPGEVRVGDPVVPEP